MIMERSCLHLDPPWLQVALSDAMLYEGVCVE